MPAAPLPPPTAAPISADVRLAYVLRHFALAYPGAPTVSVGYAGTQPQVEVADLSGAFFSDVNPYPPTPHWREWLGQRVPFFFENSAEESLLIYHENRVIITADIISAAFYLLSGWQEYFSSERDRYGRFPYAASVQKLYGFVTLPVVNYYFDVLKTAVEYVSGQPLRPRRWGNQQADFAAFISHDVDNLYSAWKAPAKTALRQWKFGLFGKLLWQHLTQPDAWNNLEAVAAQVAQYGGRSTFFVLPEHRKATDSTPNADYRLTTKLSKRLARIATQGHEIGLHGSLGTSTSESQLLAERRVVQPTAGGNRFHYLSWDAYRTLQVLDHVASNYCYDSTLGFAEYYGFRHSYCLPFYPINFATGQAAKLLEIPLHVMDATLHHPNYLQLAPTKILPALAPVFAEIKRFGGVASVLWHNQNFDPANTRNGPQQFHEIMAYLQQQGAAFLTGREIWEEFSEEAATRNS